MYVWRGEQFEEPTRRSDEEIRRILEEPTQVLSWRGGATQEQLGYDLELRGRPCCRRRRVFLGIQFVSFTPTVQRFQEPGRGAVKGQQ